MLIGANYAFIRKQYYSAKEIWVTGSIACFHHGAIYAQWSTVTGSTVCFHHDTVLLCKKNSDTETTICFHHEKILLCPKKHWYWDNSMLLSWYSIVMPCEVLILMTQYAFIMTQYCYAEWSTVTENTVRFQHDTVFYAQWITSTENTVYNASIMI